MKFSVIAVALLALAAAGDARGKVREPLPDPEKSREAVSLLLAASQEVTSAESGCQGVSEKDTTIGNIVAMQLSYLYRGRNVISGVCNGQPSKCKIRILHAFGEDVSSADVYFSVADGKVDMRTLRCVMTP